jgi:hypothetical protein
MAWFPGHSGQNTGEPGLLAADQFPIWKFSQASTAVAFLDPALKLVALASDTLKVIVRHFPSGPLFYPRIASSCFPHDPIPYHFPPVVVATETPERRICSGDETNSNS